MSSKGRGLIKLMKRIAVSLIITVFLVCYSRFALCEEIYNDSFSILKFTGGIISGFLIHEGGHALTATLADTKMDWEMGNYNQPIAFTEYSDSNDAGFLINSAGLTTQAICSEVILRADSIDKNNDYFRGMMAWNIINPILYAFDYWFINSTNQIYGDSYQGDLSGIEYYSNDTIANVFTALYVAIAISQGYRFLKKQSWSPEWMRKKDSNLYFYPSPKGGVRLSFQMRF